MRNIEHIAKSFEPAAAESRIYQKWMSEGSFRAKVNPAKKPYTIVMPPPNITGQLHMGHALNNSIQDLIIRWRRMQGYEVLWQPGTDHASIATEAKIVEAMKAEGLSKDDLGREKFLERAWLWKEQYGGRIVEQLKRLGSSCDWERERFTMDEGCSAAVKEVFIRLYSKGLIYRGKKMVNWCPHCLTTISDAEVEHEEQHSRLWHIRYPSEDGRSEVVVATTRPETMLGDTAVAVHPDDERYAAIVGQKVILPIVNKAIPVVADRYVEMEFGTGVVKITPAHDPNDYALGLRHDLEILDVLTDDGHINEKGGKYVGLDLLEARKAIVAELEEQGCIVKTEPYTHNVGTCYRCSTTIEPKLSLQWFVAMEDLAKPAIEAVRNGDTVFIPERFDKIYYNWMLNIQDWCISRQLWWGHRIPAYYCEDCGEVMVGNDMPALCPSCGSTQVVQDPDTLDTWFSSALWPFSTLGWPEKTADLEYFYPTDTLVTGPDIIFFWVARMIFSGLEQMGETPFNTVYLHGIVRDAEGRKMSKSLNNGVDPLEIIDHAGADALRFALIDGNAPGGDQRFREEKLKTGSAFINKVWNASKFVLMNLEEQEDFSAFDDSVLRMEDRWILSRLKQTIEEVSNNLEKFEFGLALTKVNSFIWESFCDWYIEMVKPRLRDRSLPASLEARAILLDVLKASLKLLHPFMPFFTEELYSYLPGAEASLMLTHWPDASAYKSEAQADADMSTLMEAVRQIRNIRTELNVPPSKRVTMTVVSSDERFAALFTEGQDYLDRLAGIESLNVQADKLGIPDNAVAAVMADGTLYIPLAELIDLELERERIGKELEKVQTDIKRLEGKLSNATFTDKAPTAVVENERIKLAKQQTLAGQLAERLRSL